MMQKGAHVLVHGLKNKAEPVMGTIRRKFKAKYSNRAVKQPLEVLLDTTKKTVRVGYKDVEIAHGSRRYSTASGMSQLSLEGHWQSALGKRGPTAYPPSTTILTSSREQTPIIKSDDDSRNPNMGMWPAT